MQLGNMGASVDDGDVVNLLFVNSRHDAEIVWLVIFLINRTNLSLTVVSNEV